MSSTGTNAAAPHERRPSLMLVGAAVAVLVLAGVIGIPLFGVLFALVFPADAPLLQDAVLLRHTSAAYGVDVWDYEINTHPCDVIAFYRLQNGECSSPPGYCGLESTRNDPLTGTRSLSGQNAGICTGVVPFSIFEMRWKATIYTPRTVDGPTSFRLEREVFWIGGVPQQR